MLTLLFVLGLAAGQTPDAREALKPGNAVYVEPTKGDDAHVHLGEQLAAWGRWRVVEAREDADLVIRRETSGSGFWNKKKARVVIHDARTDAALWTSRPTPQRRSSVLTGYQSPHEVAAKGLIEQMREASNRWPL